VGTPAGAGGGTTSKDFVFGPEPPVDGGPLLSSQDVDGMGGGGPSQAISSLTAANATRRFRPQPGQQNLHTGAEWFMRRFGEEGGGEIACPPLPWYASHVRWVCAGCVPSRLPP